MKNKATNLIFKPDRLPPFKIAADLNLVEHVHYSTGERRAINTNNWCACIVESAESFESDLGISRALSMSEIGLSGPGESVQSTSL